MSGFAEALAAALAGQAPAPVALMRLLGEAESEAVAREALHRARRAGEAPGAAQAARLLALWDEHPQAWRVVRQTIGGIAHRHADDPGATLAYWADAFDRLVAMAPEASVALYSLGSPALLAAVTDEIVGRMTEWGLLGPSIDVLDLGCGIGRFCRALAPRVRHVTGLDLSAGMIAEARRRCADLANVTLCRSDGRALGCVPDGSLDLVLAADVFPYLVEAGDGIAAMHIAEAARVLRAGGVLLILNYSYRGDIAADRRDIRRHAAGTFTVARDGSAPFKLWDGAVFLLRLRPRTQTARRNSQL